MLMGNADRPGVREVGQSQPKVEPPALPKIEKKKRYNITFSNLINKYIIYIKLDYITSYYCCRYYYYYYYHYYYYMR